MEKTKCWPSILGTAIIGAIPACAKEHRHDGDPSRTPIFILDLGTR